METTAPTISSAKPISVITPLLQNLKAVLEDEREHLASGRVDKLEVFARKKMQALAQINTYVGNDPQHAMARTEENVTELRIIDELLRENMKKLNFRIAAIGEITETIRIAVKEAEGDGTYQPGHFVLKRRR